MAFHYSPKVVTNGLVFSLDAINPKSFYSGSTIWTDTAHGNLVNVYGNPILDGNSYNFSGASQYVGTNISDLNLFNEGTIEIWTKITTFDGNYFNLIAKGAYAGWDTDGWSIETWPGGYILGFVSNIGGGISQNVTLGYYTSYTDRIHQFVLKWSRTNLTSYVDGILSQSKNFADCQPVGNNTVNYKFTLSTWYLFSYGGNFAQSVGFVRGYNRALTDNEVKQNYIGFKSRFGIV